MQEAEVTNIMDYPNKILLVFSRRLIERITLQDQQTNGQIQSINAECLNDANSQPLALIATAPPGWCEVS